MATLSIGTHPAPRYEPPPVYIEMFEWLIYIVIESIPNYLVPNLANLYLLWILVNGHLYININTNIHPHPLVSKAGTIPTTVNFIAWHKILETRNYNN